MSIAAITPQGSIAFHAGIPKEMESIKELESMPKPHTSLLPEKEEDYTKILQILLNNPGENQSEKFVNASFLYSYNEDADSDLLRNSGAKRCVKSHESLRGGFQNLF